MAVSVELPAAAEQGAVKNLQQALLRAIKDQLQVSLDDEDAAAALVGNATLTTSVATRKNGGGAKDTYVYTLTAWVPVALVGQAALGGSRGRRRALSAGAIPAALDGLQQSGYLLQRLHELGFDADALASSGALELSGGLVAPPSASPSPAGAATITLRLGGLPAGAFDTGSGALTAIAVGKITAGLSAGVATACPTCTVRVLRVEDSVGAQLYAAARRLGAQGAVTVFSAIYGAGALAARGAFDESAASAALTARFGAPVTASVVSSSVGGGSGSGGSSGGSSGGLSGGGAVGISVAAVLLVLAAGAIYFFCAPRPAAAKKVDLRLRSVAAPEAPVPPASVLASATHADINVDIYEGVEE